MDGQQKSNDEDIKHIFKGIMQPKGFVHLSFGDQIVGDYSPEELAHRIDVSVLKNYEIWETNMYSFKLLNDDVSDNDFPRASKYFNDLRTSMTNKQLDYIMRQYANPLIAKGELTNE